jgi:hypothetical protein
MVLMHILKKRKLSLLLRGFDKRKAGIDNTKTLSSVARGWAQFK